jgi:hypothetical protein
MMSSDFAWSLSKAYTLSFVGLYVTMYLSSYVIKIPNVGHTKWANFQNAGNIHIYKKKAQ